MNGSNRSTTCCSLAGRRESAGCFASLAITRRLKGVKQPFTANTPYINTIPPQEQPPFPGSREIERRIKSLVRWNALAMVVKANKLEEGIGGHISTLRIGRHVV